MSTPAELLAQQQDAYQSDSSVPTLDTEIATGDETPSSPMSDTGAKKNGSGGDASFPVLGSVPTASSQGTKSVWGTASVSQTNGAHAAAKKVPHRSATVQETFTMDLDQAATITKAELSKLLSDLKTSLKVNVETTLSQRTNRRTFLISGSDEANKRARRQIIKSLSKPVTIEFQIPSKLRGTVIGPGGRSLTPIVSTTGCKVDISSETVAVDGEPIEDDFFGAPVAVKVQGDFEGVHMAKQMILAIVDEHTKNVSVRVEIPQSLKFFAQQEIESSITVPESVDVSVPAADEASSKISISGARTDALQLRDDIRDLFSTLSASIKTESKTVKKSFHGFIDPKAIFEKTSVVVGVPPASDASSDVSFSGLPKNIKKAVDLVKEITDSYKVLTLDISKAHGGDLGHAKNLGAYFSYSGLFKQLSTDSITVSTVAYPVLFDADTQSVQVDISCASGVSRSDAEAVKKSVIEKVNLTPPHAIKTITDIEPFVFKKLDSAAVKDAARAHNVTVVPVASLVNAGKTLLLVADPVETDFLPTAEEISSRLDAVDAVLDDLRALSGDVVSQVVTVASAEQDLINASTLRTILSHYTPDSVDVKLHQNAEGESPNELLIHGLKDEVPRVIDEIRQVIEDVKNYEIAVKYNDTIKFATNLLSRLIGQKGANVNGLKDQFGVKIDVGNDKDTSTDIKLTGLKVNVDAAIAEINSLAKKWADEKTLTFNIDRKYHKLLLARAYLKRLEDKYKVHIQLGHNDDSITVRGPSKGVVKTEEEIRDLAKYEAEHGHKISIQVPTYALARVIGKGGKSIEGISDSNGIEYKFNRDDDKEKELGYADIELIGTKKGIADAKKEIEEIVANSYTVKITVPSKHVGFLIGKGNNTRREIIQKAGGDATGFSLLSFSPADSDSEETVVSTGPRSVVEAVIEQVKSIIAKREDEITEIYDIPKDKHNLIIGPQGSIRKSLQSDYDVVVVVPAMGSTDTGVKIVGAPEDVEKAKAKIADLTKDDWSSEILVPAPVHFAIAERSYLFRRLKNDFKVSVTHGLLSRKATKLSNSEIPTPPEEVYGEETTKWTVVEDEESRKAEEEESIPWRLKGDTAAVKKAETLINKLVEQSKNHTATGYFYTSSPEIFGKIVGPRAKRVQELKERTGCFIVVPSPDDKINNVIYVRGDKEGLEKVKNSFLTSSL